MDSELDYDPPWAVDTDPGWRCMMHACGANTRQRSQHEDEWGGVEQVPWRDGLGDLRSQESDIGTATSTTNRTWLIARGELRSVKLGKFLASGGAQHFGATGS